MSRLYPKLNDKKWLLDSYLEKKMSLEEIQRIIGAKNHNSVRQHLIKYGVEIRNISDGLTCKRKDSFVLDHDIIEGCLLGDGSLRKCDKHSNMSYPTFQKKNKFKDHVEYVAKHFFPEGDFKIFDDVNKINGKILTYHLFRTGARKEFLPYFRRWYPESNGFKKLVPEDINLTPKVILNWFMDDGSTTYRNRKELKNPHTKEVICIFSCESFLREDQERLCSQMKNKFDLNPTIITAQWGTGWRIKIRQAEVQDFLQVIGPCPVKSMQYKWKGLDIDKDS